MRVVEFLKENQQKARQVQVQLVDKIEPKWRSLSGTMNKKLADALSTPIGQQYLALFDSAIQKKEAWLEAHAEMADTYQYLQSQLGEETHLGDWFKVTQDCINGFAEVTGDKQWIHVDQDRAAKSRYKSTIAHGFLTLSLVPRLSNSIEPDSNDYPQAQMIVNYGLNKVRFPYPVKQGKNIRARTRLMHVDVVAKNALEVIKEVKVEIEGSSRPACIVESVVRLYF
jgi:acyl dehydratase